MGVGRRGGPEVMGALLRCQRAKLLAGPLPATMLAFSLAVLALCVARDSELLIMVAGERPEAVGGAIGFLFDVVDPASPSLSCARTALASTILWVPACVLCSGAVLSRDRADGSAAVSYARGLSPARALLARAIGCGALVIAPYLATTVAIFACKLSAAAAPPDAAAWSAFAGALVVCALLLASLVGEVALLFSLTRGVLGSTFACLALAVLVLFLYPSAYARALYAGAGDPVAFAASPVYHLMWVCSLSGLPRSLALGGLCGLAATAGALALAAAVDVRREW